MGHAETRASGNSHGGAGGGAGGGRGGPSVRLILSDISQRPVRTGVQSCQRKVMHLQKSICKVMVYDL